MSNSGKRVAWLTGGGSRIGEAGAKAFAADGCTVRVSGRRKDAPDAAVAASRAQIDIARPVTGKTKHVWSGR